MMSRDKSVWFAEEILLDAKLINYQVEAGEWAALEEMLRAEAQLSRDAETGRLRPKKASEYTLRLIAEVLHMMSVEAHTQLTVQSLGVAEQSLRLVRCCAAAGTKIQTFICKELTILDSMLALSAAYHTTDPDSPLYTKFTHVMKIVMQCLGNLVVNNPYNQITVWDKLDGVIVEELSAGGPTAHPAAMIVYNILLTQPHILPARPSLLDMLGVLHSSSEYAALVLESLVATDAGYLDKLYPHLAPDTRALLLAHANHMLTNYTDSQEVCVSVSFVRLMASEFKVKSDGVLRTCATAAGDARATEPEPAEVMVLLDNLCAASAIHSYLHALQTDASLLINAAFLLRAVHKLGKESNNFFSSINKLYSEVGLDPALAHATTHTGANKNDSADTLVSCAESQSECTESESSEHYYECLDTNTLTPDTGLTSRKASACSVAEATGGAGAASAEPPLILEVGARPTSILHPDCAQLSSPEMTPDEPLTEIQILPTTATDTKQQQPTTDATKQQLATDSARADNIGSTTAERRDSASQETVGQTSPKIALLATHSPGSSRDESSSPPLLLEGAAKSQNLSTDFNLGEQLEKILGISSEKARSGGGAGGGEERARAPPTVKIDHAEPCGPRESEDAARPRRVVSEVQTVRQHVAFGLKAALVRLVANLCWRHAANKQTVRECEVIPVLLDCCNIDARNPYIMQWVIYALRNLCENCPQNQKVISELSGPLPSKVLQDVGIHTTTDNNTTTARHATSASSHATEQQDNTSSNATEQQDKSSNNATEQQDNTNSNATEQQDNTNN